MGIEEDAWGGAGLKLIIGKKVRKAKTTKHTEMVICRVAMKETIMWGIV